MNFLNSIAKLKKERYDNLRERHPYIFKWKWYSYRKFKLKFYIEASSILAYFCIKFHIKPNYITAVYAMMGLSGGILLAIPSRPLIVVAILFYYSRGILDWTDGLVARANNQISVSGMVFDSYGAHLGWVSLWTGLGIYLGHYTNPIFFYLTPILPFLFAADLYANARETIIYHHLLKNYKAESRKEEALKNSNKSKIKKIKNFINIIF